MKVCLLSYRGNPYSGGQGIYIKYIAEELVRQGHEVHLIVGPPYPHPIKGVILHTIDNSHYYGLKGIDVINREFPFEILHPVNFYEYLNTRLGAFSEISSFTIRAYILLRELNEKHSFDIVHDNQSLGYGLLMIKTLGVPVISTIHHPLSIDLQSVLGWTFTFKKKLKTVMFYPVIMQKIVSKRLDHIITVSESSKKMITADFGVPSENQTVVYNGIDRSIFRPMKGIKKSRNMVLFVGNIEDRNKGLAYLLKALKILNKNIRLTVVDGGSPHRRITGILLEKLGLSDRVKFTGKISTEELVRLYSEARLAVVPSVFEGFGFPAAEAMSCGTPVIVSDGGALPEVAGNAGIVVPARDHEALAAAIDSVLSDNTRLKRMSSAGIERVISRFSWPDAVEKMADIYRLSANY